MKTLKDLGSKREAALGGMVKPYTMFSDQELKAAAIEWVKESDRQQENDGDDNKFRCGEYRCPNVRDWIVMFFNLTEEDLR